MKISKKHPVSQIILTFMTFTAIFAFIGCQSGNDDDDDSRMEVSSIIDMSGTNFCTQEHNRSGIDVLPSQLVKWNEANVSEYDMTIQTEGVISRTFLAQVKDDSFTSVQVRISSTSEFESVAQANWNQISTINGYFESIPSFDSPEVETLNVNYDEILGYPTRIEVDQQDCFITSENTTMVVSDTLSVTNISVTLP